ncbi:hypothetical protein F4780DRAFT_288052 [Xylariomycetidae sp. FL0641]|nr:hypothetical protein F4780DRAFT_288052 [Xylariomycetidae sp. FL0641]
MGNTPSVEAPRRGFRAAHKHSKSRSDNAAAAGLLSPGVAPERSRPSFLSRRLSLPYGSTPAPSPRHLPSDVEAMSTFLEGGNDSEPGDRDRERSSRSLFRSHSAQVPSSHSRRSNSVGVVTDSKGRRRLSRASSVRPGYEDTYSYSTAHAVSGTSSVNTSRLSMNYDVSSYVSKRLLNLAEEPSHGDHSTMSESQLNPMDTRRQSLTSTTRAPTATPASPLPRSNSDVSLYAPMRRRSLMTPGLATRTSVPYATSPHPRARYSLPPTPARRDSFDASFETASSHPQFLEIPELIQRASTPCEADYQPGVFKLGTLRITNGSPATTPGSEDMDLESRSGGNKKPEEEVDYFAAGRSSKGNVYVTNNAENRHALPGAANAMFPQVILDRPASGNKERTTSQSASGLQITALASNAASPASPELHTTSKHTAIEDDLFEDEPEEYGRAEVLDVRVDPSARSEPRPRLVPERKEPQELSRADSGIVATPASEFSHRALSKADSGYSSNVSLRSFSSKPSRSERGRGRAAEASGASEASGPVASVPSRTRSTSTAATKSQPSALNSPTDRSPPPVPNKDCVASNSVKKASYRDSSRTRYQNFRPASGKTRNVKTECTTPSRPSSTSQSNDGPQQTFPLSPTTPKTPTSPLSITNTPRKTGKLHRLLSNARTPLVAHVTHPTDVGDVPPVPQDVQAKLHEHTGLLTMSFKKLSLRQEVSRETLGTIMSVGSAETSRGQSRGHSRGHSRGNGSPGAEDVQDGKDAPTSRTQGKGDAKPASHIHAVGSSFTRAASSVLAKKAGVKKPAPIRTTPLEMRDGLEATLASPQGRSGPVPIPNPRSPRGSESPFNASFLAASLRETYYKEPRERGRAATMTAASMPAASEARARSMVASFRHREDMARGDIHSPTSIRSPTFLEPPVPSKRSSVSKTPPPVSMRTRNMGCLRVPPPLRARSTPPGTPRMGEPSSLSHQSSREAVQSQPSTLLADAQPLLARKSSRELIQSYPPAQGQSSAQCSSRRSAGVVGRPENPRSQSRGRGLPSWESQAKQGTPISRPVSVDRHRRASVHGQSIQRNNAHAMAAWSELTADSTLPVLRHRSSSDRADFVPPPIFARDNGPYPSVGRANGQSCVSDPWSGRRVTQHFDHRGPSLPHVPRGHYRHRSMDQSGTSAPYRVLHSYNSPAYRNAPIWG